MFIVSSDLFTFSGLDDYEDGIPSLRTWAITHTERIAQVSPCSAAMSAGVPPPCLPTCRESGLHAQQDVCSVSTQQVSCMQLCHIAGACAALPLLMTPAMQGFPGGVLPDISQPVVLLTESLQYPTVEFYDSTEQTSVISQPSGRQIDARDERLRQVSLADGLLWTSTPTAADVGIA